MRAGGKISPDENFQLYGSWKGSLVTITSLCHLSVENSLHETWSYNMLCAIAIVVDKPTIVVFLQAREGDDDCIVVYFWWQISDYHNHDPTVYDPSAV